MSSFYSYLRYKEIAFAKTFVSYYRFFLGGGQREGYVGRTWPKKPKMALISEYLAADSSPDASADAQAMINISKF